MLTESVKRTEAHMKANRINGQKKERKEGEESEEKDETLKRKCRRKKREGKEHENSRGRKTRGRNQMERPRGNANRHGQSVTLFGEALEVPPCFSGVQGLQHYPHLFSV